MCMRTSVSCTYTLIIIHRCEVFVVGAAVGPTLYDAAGRLTFYESKIICDVNNHRRSIGHQIRGYVFELVHKIL